MAGCAWRSSGATGAVETIAVAHLKVLADEYTHDRMPAVEYAV
jgi:hypothetical protein